MFLSKVNEGELEGGGGVKCDLNLFLVLFRINVF